jgi:hypothetical protein
MNMSLVLLGPSLGLHSRSILSINTTSGTIPKERVMLFVQIRIFAEVISGPLFFLSFYSGGRCAEIRDSGSTN